MNELADWPPAVQERIRCIVDAAPPIPPDSPLAHTLAVLLWPPRPATEAPVPAAPIASAA